MSNETLAYDGEGIFRDIPCVTVVISRYNLSTICYALSAQISAIENLHTDIPEILAKKHELMALRSALLNS